MSHTLTTIILRRRHSSPSAPHAGLLPGGLLLSVRTKVWEMSQDNLSHGGHQSGHQSQGGAEGSWTGMEIDFLIEGDGQRLPC